MLADSLLPTTFWAEAVNTACYVQNRVLVTKPHNKTPYELLLGRPPSISFMRPFGCPVTILNTLNPLGKFDGKADEGFFVGYSINSKAFKPLTGVSQVSPSVSAVGQSFDNADDLPTDPLMPDLEDTADLLNTGIFSGAYDDEDEEGLDIGYLPNASSAIGTNGSLENKEDERGFAVRNKARWWHKMDVKSAFLYGTIEEEVSTKKSLCTKFESLMHKKFQMSSMGLTFFLGLQVKQKDDGIFISQDKLVIRLEASLARFYFLVSLIEKFWQTTTVRTVDNGEQEITATVDGKEFTITKASIRRHLQLADVEGGNTPRSDEERLEQDDLMDFVPPTPHDSPLLGGHTPGSDEGDFDDDFDDIDDMVNKEMENVGDTVNVGGAVNTATIGVSAASTSVTTAGVSISTAELRTPPTTTTTAFEDEDLTIAQTFVKMRSEKAKEKGAAVRDVEEYARSTKILPTIDPKDKGKGIMQEPEKPPKNPRKAQIQMDEELAIRLQEEEKAELEKMQRERAAQEEAYNAALITEFDDVQARMDADALLAARL
ncbi:putative ribonuclease H-like domain-containing protein [Tanacetum coccineum]